MSVDTSLLWRTAQLGAMVAEKPIEVQLATRFAVLHVALALCYGVTLVVVLLHALVRSASLH